MEYDSASEDRRYMALYFGEMHAGVFRSQQGISLSFGEGRSTGGVRLNTADARLYAALIVTQCDAQDAVKPEAV